MRWMHVAIGSIVVLLLVAVGLAERATTDHGNWPATWPTELEPYRAQAQTEFRAGGTDECVHQIPFTSRDDFEKAWPHILSLKTAGAPLILETAGSSYKGMFRPMNAGVQIKSDAPPGRGPTPETRNRSATWPEYLRLPSGGLPEYVDFRDGKWVAADTRDTRAIGAILYRARVDIVLVVDGKIVDLNRLQFPPDTPIIDHRFGQ